jgi:hypothetical protein
MWEDLEMPLYSTLTENKGTPNQRMFGACRIICSRPEGATVNDQTRHMCALMQLEGILSICFEL